MSRLLISLLLFCLLPLPVAASDALRLSHGESVYVPVYANVFSAPKAIPFQLSTLLCIRNTNLNRPITITTVDYYDTKGKYLRSFGQKNATLAPLESLTFYLPPENNGAGAGANFIVQWRSDRQVNAPVIESVMIGSRSGQGISFVSRGQVIQENLP